MRVPFPLLWSWLLLHSGVLARAPTLGFPLPPDSRPPGCSSQTVDTDGKGFSDLKVSIIIPYRNEKWEHIRGSLASVLHFTPKSLIAEILMVSDGNSAKTMFMHELQAMSPLITVLAFNEPGVGLIEAKTRAVGAASPAASVLLFLEPHVRVNVQWLEPLLARLRLHPKVLAMPTMDPIPQHNFDEYQTATHGHWRFEWNFNLIYTNPGRVSDKSNLPFLSPATSGGIFAIKKDWWNALGFYDIGMLGWGGDHVEATMKVWRCGGHIEVVPCSRVGHLFRDPENRPYPVGVDQVVRNYGRMAEVWMDEYLPTFRKVKPETKDMDVGDLTEPRAQRAQLECKSMKWYLENVDREMQWEKDHICIPGCSRKAHGTLCCEKPAASGRSTIDRTIPFAEYRPLPNPDANWHVDEL